MRTGLFGTSPLVDALAAFDCTAEETISWHPIIEDDVVIYAGATIPGRLAIGRGSTIGGSIWPTESVPPGSRDTLLSANRGRAAGSGSSGDKRDA